MTIKELRKEYNMTQAEFSSFFGIPKRTIGDWECDKRKCKNYIIDLLEYKLINELGK